MSDENCVLLCGFKKDFEITSWNEQGEITQIEGMLTIAFLVISPCSHIDNWKQLYCVIKIPYLVNMPTKKEMIGITKSVGEELLDERQSRLQLDELVKIQNIKIESIESENKELKEKVEKLEKKLDETNKVKKENRR